MIILRYSWYNKYIYLTIGSLRLNSAKDTRFRVGAPCCEWPPLTLKSKFLTHKLYKFNRKLRNNKYYFRLGYKYNHEALRPLSTTTSPYMIPLINLEDSEAWINFFYFLFYFLNLLLFKNCLLTKVSSNCSCLIHGLVTKIGPHIVILYGVRVWRFNSNCMHIIRQWVGGIKYEYWFEIDFEFLVWLDSSCLVACILLREEKRILGQALKIWAWMKQHYNNVLYY